MDNTLSSLQPQAIWKHFAEICKIPHPSGNLDKITEYIMQFGKSHGLDTYRDVYKRQR